MIGWGASDFFASQASNKVGNFKTLFWSQIAGLLTALILIPVFGFNLTNDPLSIFYVIIVSVLYTVGYLLFYKAFEIGNISIVSITINLDMVVAVILAVIFSHQSLTIKHLLAVALIFTGISLVSINLDELKNKKVTITAGIKEAIGAAIAFGIAQTLSEQVSETIGWLPTTIYIKLGLIVILLLVTLVTKNKLSLGRTTLKTKSIIGIVGILEAIALLSVEYGYMVGDLVVVTPISSALSIVTILMAVVFLKEKLTKLQVTGIVATLIGVVTIATL